MEVLGDENNLKDLRRDLNDIQEVISDIISRVGPLKFNSWKYPNKFSVDINIAEILSFYEYDKNDTENNQLSHIITFELLIDRFLFLIQLSSFMIEKNDAGTDSSIGLIVKRFSSILLKKTRALSANGNRIKSSSTCSRCSSTTNLEQVSFLTRHQATSISRNSNSIHENLAKDEYNKAIQTIETEFVPCEECFKVQAFLKKLAENCIAICKENNIPSIMEQHLLKVQELPWLSSADINRWVAEQNKDLSKISKQITFYSGKIQELEKNTSLLEKKLNNEKLEIQKIRKELNESKNSCKGWLERVETLKIELKSKNTQCDKQELEITELERKQEIIGLLEKSVADTNEEINGFKKSLEQSLNENKDLKNNLNQLENQLNKSLMENANLKSEIDAAGQVKNVFKTKQLNLLSDIEEIAEENDKLRRKLLNLENNYEEKISFLKHNLNSEDEIRQAKRELERKHDRETVKFEQEIVHWQRKCKELEERITTLVKYPETAPPPPLTDRKNKKVNIIDDMNKQIEANNLRIDALNQENEQLSNSVNRISKVLEPSSVREKTYTKQKADILFVDRQNDVMKSNSFHSDIDRYDYKNVQDKTNHEMLPDRWADKNEFSPDSQHEMFGKKTFKEIRRNSNTVENDEYKIKLWNENYKPNKRINSAKTLNNSETKSESFNPSLAAYTKIKQSVDSKKTFQSVTCPKCNRAFTSLPAKELHYMNCRKKSAKNNGD